MRTDAAEVAFRLSCPVFRQQPNALALPQAGLFFSRRKPPKNRPCSTINRSHHHLPNRNDAVTADGRYRGNPEGSAFVKNDCDGQCGKGKTSAAKSQERCNLQRKDAVRGPQSSTRAPRDHFAASLSNS